MVHSETQYHIIKRGTEKPRGKERIYITGHSADRMRMSAIAEEIVNVLDCEVYIKKDLVSIPDELDEEHKLYLEHVDLVVFVVSNNFLFDRNFAREREYAFIVSEKRPVFFIAVESSLEKKFNEICGNFHMLFMEAYDYHGKLKSSLDDRFNKFYCITEEDETLDEYYSAKAFISYRKKNRILANKLMKQIRSLDFCRDIILWHDDFLTAGEDYNNEIAEQIINSDIIFLLVAPDLLEEPNYVMDKEYPIAKKAGKIIIPIMVEETNVELLKEKFSGIKDCVYINVDGDLEEAIKGAFKELNIEIKPYSTWKKYRLGSSYIDGKVLTNSSKGIEKNVQMGKFLLEEAAKEGCEYAMNRLGMLYFTGELIEQDLEMAEYWLVRAEEKLAVEFLRVAKGEEAAFSVRDTYRILLGVLGDLFLMKNNLDDAELTIRKRLAVHESNNKVGLFWSGKTNVGTILMQLGGVLFMREQYAEAEECYIKAEKILLEYERSMPMKINIYMSMHVYVRKGDLYLKLLMESNNKNILDYARIAYEEALKRAVALCKEYRENCFEEITHCIDALDDIRQICYQRGYSDIERKILQVITPISEYLYDNIYTTDNRIKLALFKFNLAVAGVEVPDRDLLVEAFNILNDLCQEYPFEDEYIQKRDFVKDRIKVWPINLG